MAGNPAMYDHIHAMLSLVRRYVWKENLNPHKQNYGHLRIIAVAIQL